MVRVSVTEGLIEGELVQNEYGGTYYSFKGIPYAQPPIGDLRFKAPKLATPWEGVRDAKKFGPICYQDCPLAKFDLENMSEDCLYINVYTPEVKPKKLLPVIFLIHCGGYYWGSGNDDLHGPQFLMRHGVVLVTFNYRVGALGFLCLNTKDVPGNAGMKDQVAALRWAVKNIHNFGGDPNNITLMGESAGASSVAYHSISSMSKGLFKRIIAQSGSPTSWWAKSFEPHDVAMMLAKRLGCFSEDDKEVFEFLKSQPVESLVGLELHLWKAQKPIEIHFTVADEKDFGQERFFHGDVFEKLRNGIHEGVEVLTGYNPHEGMLTAALYQGIQNMMAEAKYYSHFFTPIVIRRHCVIADQMKVGRKMRQFYFKDGNISSDNLIKFAGMDMFAYDVIRAARFYAKKNKVYLYKFLCVSERNTFGYHFGQGDYVQGKEIVSHCDDLCYLLAGKSNGKVTKNDTFKTIDKIVTLWTNFAKYGNPTPDGSLGNIWKPFTVNNQEYMEINNNSLTMDNAPEKEELKFWDSIYKEYLPMHSL